MIFLGYDKQSTEDTQIQLIHYMPEELPQEMIEQGLLVESVPEPEVREDKHSVFMINPVTKELYYNYFDVPLTKEQEMENKIKLMQKALDELLLGGM